MNLTASLFQTQLTDFFHIFVIVLLVKCEKISDCVRNGDAVKFVQYFSYHLMFKLLENSSMVTNEYITIRFKAVVVFGLEPPNFLFKLST